MAYHRAILKGEDVSDWHFKDEIIESHKGFQKWIGENQERIGNDYVDNVHKLEQALGIKRGKRMNHKDADTGSVNPNFGKTEYSNNCSTCSGVYILRRMGFNVEALPKTSKIMRGDNALFNTAYSDIAKVK